MAICLKHDRVRSITFVAAGLMLFSLCVTVCPSANAQNPFGDLDPVGGPAAPAGGEADDAGAEDDDVVVQAIRDSDPTTPIELINAGITMLNYEKPREARKYLKKFIDGKFDQAALVAVHREFGFGTFIRLSREESVQPEGDQISKMVTKAAVNYSQNPQRIEQLVNQLSAGDAQASAAASVELRSVPVSASINPLLRVMGSEDRVSEHFKARLVLEDADTSAIPPLLAAMDSNNQTLKANVIRVLTTLKARGAQPYFVAAYLAANSSETVRELAAAGIKQRVGAVPTTWEGQRFLYQYVRKQFEDSAPIDPLLASRLPDGWMWDGRSNQVIRSSLSADDARRQNTARLAAQLYRLAPSKPDFVRLYVATALENRYASPASSLSSVPVDSPFGNSLKVKDVATLEAVLSYSLKHGRTAAAIGAADLLGQTSDASVLENSAGTPRPLAAALMHKNRDVRFAALRAVLAIAPESRYPGSSRTIEAIEYFLKSGGMRRAVVGFSSLTEAQSLTGILATIGIEADTGVTGTGVLQRIRESADIEFIMLSDGIDQPDLLQTIQLIRTYPGTAKTPIGIMAKGEKGYQDASVMAERLELVEAFPRVHTVAAAAWVTDELQSLPGRDSTTVDHRLKQARQALAMANDLMQQEQQLGFYDFRRLETALIQAFRNPDLSLAAAPAMGQMATPKTQTELVEYVSSQVNPIKNREAAADAFNQSVKRRGILLTAQQVLLQFDRYNASEKSPAETQQVLASILDTIEPPPENE